MAQVVRQVARCRCRRDWRLAAVRSRRATRRHRRWRCRRRCRRWRCGRRNRPRRRRRSRRRTGRTDARGATGVRRRGRDEAEERMHGLEPAIQLQHHHATTTAVELQRSEGGPVGAHLEERWHDLWVGTAVHPQCHVAVRPCPEDRVALVEDRTSASHECIPRLPIPQDPLCVVVQLDIVAPLTTHVGRDHHCKQWVAVHARVQLGNGLLDVVRGDGGTELAVAPCLVGVELGLGALAPIFRTGVGPNGDHSQPAQKQQQTQRSGDDDHRRRHSVSGGVQGTTPFLGFVNWIAFRIQNTSPLSKARK